MEISKKAGDLVGLLYEALLKKYGPKPSPADLHSLNVLCVRLVFCLYAEDAGIFGRHLLFHDYLKQFSPQKARRALEELFDILDTKEDERPRFLSDDDPILASFPYVNGGLFSKKVKIDIPRSQRTSTTSSCGTPLPVSTGRRSARRYSAQCLNPL